MKKILKKIINWLRKRHMYVIADATDNSITFSRALFQHMGGLSLEKAKVFAFYIPSKLCKVKYTNVYQ